MNKSYKTLLCNLQNSSNITNQKHFQTKSNNWISYNLKIILFFVFILFSSNVLKAKEPFTFTDIMKFNALRTPQITEDGKYVSYLLRPERGDTKIIIQPTALDTLFTFEQSSSCSISKNSEWAAIT
ncbi:MAG TPA: hypothetical protein PKY56_06360, partial [Candidatus Kapabacteria bacterium]|nr:hypothetical protein [Candidatus Kapabacteria bacterium]